MLSRRRFVSIAASAVALPNFSPHAKAAAPAPVVWRGVAMGAMASMTLVHPDRDAARRLIERCLVEISRLEAIFSLYRPDSALVRLNAEGVLDHPPLELVEVLSFAASLARHSDGAFDATVQPLFELYARHFAEPHPDPAGPPPARLAEALALVDHREVDIASDRIALGRPGMKLTLNGIAQGYVTDRVAALLAAAGLENLLLDLGEVRGAGRRPDGKPWRAAIADPVDPTETLFTLDLPERPGLPALATSGGYGMAFDPERRHHHIFDPATGQSAMHHASVTVSAPSALVADGLSTAIAALPADRCGGLIDTFAPARAWSIRLDGRINDILAA
ncbi:MAG TPA: FAD:protein FMN transferase [Aestuariivirgaceae bacterium]|nr:FAD:protein FMN transferase [Aestuariivirgaceae bacterium]